MKDKFLLHAKMSTPPSLYFLNYYEMCKAIYTDQSCPFNHLVKKDDSTKLNRMLPAVLLLELEAPTLANSSRISTVMDCLGVAYIRT